MSEMNPEVPERPSPSPWEQKAAEIEAKQRELERREAELRQREQTLGTGPEQLRSKNWPALYPLVSHDIESEIPATTRHLARQSFLLWKMTVAGYGLNLAASIFGFVTGSEGIFSLIFSLLYFGLFPAAAFASWHMSLYHALRLNSGVWYAAFFAAFSLQILFLGLIGVGLMNGGAGGVFGTIGAIASGKLVYAAVVGTCTAVTAFNLFGSVYQIQAVGRQYWNRGQTAKDLTEAAAANPNIVQYALNNMA